MRKPSPGHSSTRSVEPPIELPIEPPEGFARYRTRASILLRSPGELKALSVRVTRKLADTGAVAETFSAARGQLRSLLALLKAYANGEYREVSSRSLISIVAALVYFVVPMDLVPDFLLGLGLLDDAAVIGYVFSLVGKEVSDFEDWRQSSGDQASGNQAERNE
jgi:uncharacterized membrane protein YkvA (DUF1232 family)